MKRVYIKVTKEGFEIGEWSEERQEYDKLVTPEIDMVLREAKQYFKEQ